MSKRIVISIDFTAYTDTQAEWVKNVVEPIVTMIKNQFAWNHSRNKVKVSTQAIASDSVQEGAQQKTSWNKRKSRKKQSKQKTLFPE